MSQRGGVQLSWKGVCCDLMRTRGSCEEPTSGAKEPPTSIEARDNLLFLFNRRPLAAVSKIT